MLSYTDSNVIKPINKSLALTSHKEKTQPYGIYNFEQTYRGYK